MGCPRGRTPGDADSLNRTATMLLMATAVAHRRRHDAPTPRFPSVAAAVAGAACRRCPERAGRRVRGDARPAAGELRGRRLGHRGTRRTPSEPGADVYGGAVG